MNPVHTAFIQGLGDTYQLVKEHISPAKVGTGSLEFKLLAGS